MSSPKTLARIAGALYLAMSVCFVFAGSVRSRVIAPGDAAATADNIRESTSLFRIGLVSDLVSGAMFLFTAMALYLLLAHVDRVVAAAMVVFVAVSVAVGCLNLVNQYAALTLATRADYAAAFGRTGSEALVMLFADLHSKGLVMNEMFWGLWLLPLGLLVIRSGYFPKTIGVLLIVACFAWLTHLFVRFLAPELGHIASFLVLGAIGELVFLFWLLVIGATVPVSRIAEPAAGRGLEG